MGKTVDKGKKIVRLRSQIDNASISKPTNIDKLFGLLKGKLNEDPVVLQRKWRNEDR